MPVKTDEYRALLEPLLDAALASGDPAPLARFLEERSGLPGPRLNLALVSTFAGLIGESAAAPDPPVAQLEALLDGWAALPLAAAPANDPREILPAAAVRAYGEVAVRRPDWWDDETAKLRRAAADPRWRTRELVATALQGMLNADWPRTYRALEGWVADGDALVVRAAAAAVAEPPLLRDRVRGEAALAVQVAAMRRFGAVPRAQRAAEPVRVLRQALGYTLSVAVAAAPEAGFPYLEDWAAQPDPDLRWIVRENLKKHRLGPWADRVAAVQARLA